MARHAGTIFKLTPNGLLTSLSSFNVSNGFVPRAELAQDDFLLNRRVN
jgi:hypothetical protein